MRERRYGHQQHQQHRPQPSHSHGSRGSDPFHKLCLLTLICPLQLEKRHITLHTRAELVEVWLHKFQTMPPYQKPPCRAQTTTGCPTSPLTMGGLFLERAQLEPPACLHRTRSLSSKWHGTSDPSASCRCLAGRGDAHSPAHRHSSFPFKLCQAKYVFVRAKQTCHERASSVMSDELIVHPITCKYNPDSQTLQMT